MNITDRMQKLLLAKGVERKQIRKTLAAACGISYQAVSQWFSGETGNIKNENLIAVAEKFGSTVDWLLSGTGEMLTEKGRKSSNVTQHNQPKRQFEYPVISWVQAGHFSEAIEPFPPGCADTYELSDYEAKGLAFWLKVRGDSMTAPTGLSIPEGMLILVDPEADATPGRLVVAKLTDSNEATFKKLVEDLGTGKRYLRPLNPDYKPIEINGNCKIVGVVVQAKMNL